MKNLKFRINLLSLIAVALVIVFMSSCQEQEKNIVTEQVEDNADSHVGKAFKLPKGYEDITEEEIGNYMSKLSTDEFEQLVENNRVTAFLTSINQLDQVYASLEKGGLLTEDYASKFITVEQMQQLKNYTFDNEIDSRFCTGCNHAYSECPVNGCKGTDGNTYISRHVYKRTCFGHTYVCKTTCS